MRVSSPRERILLVLLVVLGLGAAFYFFIYGPRTQAIARLQGELDQARAKQADYERLVTEQESLEREYRVRQLRIESIEAKLPPEREIPTMLRQMQAVATEAGVTLTLLRPGPMEDPTAARPGQPAAPAAPGQALPGASEIGYRLFRLDLAFEGTYQTVLTFLRRLENFPRFLAMNQLTLNAQDLPTLRLSVVANTFVLPEGSPP